MTEQKPNKPPAMDMPSATNEKGTASLGPEVRERIARDLRNMWDEVVREGVPPQFVDFIDRLAQREKTTAPDAGGEPKAKNPKTVGDNEDEGAR